MTKPIPPHVWALVLPHLRNPIPYPLSAPSRSALRQPWLASASRVSRLFKAECYKLLYRNITTDNVPALFKNFHSPSHRARFANTRSLYIEYSEKGEHGTYKELVKQGKDMWRSCGQNEESIKKQMMLDCGREVESLAEALQEVNAFGALPRLETVAVNSVYGAMSTTWCLYADEEQEPLEGSDTINLYPCTLPCVKDFDEFLFRCSNAQHLCFRDTYGPLSPLTLTHPSYRGSRPYTITTHISTRTIEPLSLARGATKTRFCLDSPLQMNWITNLRWLESGLRRESARRKDQRDSHDSHSPDCKEACSGPPANIEIYSSASWSRGRFQPNINTFNLPSLPIRKTEPLQTISPADQTYQVKVLGGLVQAFLRRDSGVQDVAQWRESGDIPTCEACGSGAPGRLQGWTPDGEEQE